MAFDPSIISQIPDFAPNPMRQKENAYRLADLIDTQQLNRLKLNSAKATQVDQEKTKTILKDADYSTPEGVTKTAEKLSRAGLSDQAMDFMKVMQGLQSSKGELQKQQYELMSVKNDMIGNATAALVNEFDMLTQRGVPPQQALGMMQPKYQATIQQLAQTKLPDGSPALGPQDLQQIQANPQFNPDFVRTIAQRSKEGAAALKSQLEFHKSETADRRLDESERHNREMEGLATRKQTTAETGVYEKEDLDFLAEQYLAGDKSVFQNLGRGAQGAKNVISLRQAIRRQAQAQGMDGKDVAAKIAEFNGILAGQRALGTRTANVEMAVNEAYNMIDIAKKASHEVPRGTFRPWNQLVKGENVITNDPNYAKFAAATLAVVNTWARAISPSGVPTVADKEHAHQVLNTAQSQEAYDAVLDQFKAEIEAARKAPGQVRQEFREGVAGEPGEPGPGGSTAPTPPPDTGQKPYTDSDKEARYQAWKKAHGGQ